jgi:hypothetical protein
MAQRDDSFRRTFSLLMENAESSPRYPSVIAAEGISMVVLTSSELYKNIQAYAETRIHGRNRLESCAPIARK